MKWTFIRAKKPTAIVGAVPTVIALVVAVTLIVTVGVFLTATGYTFAALRRKSRKKRSLSNLYMLPEGYVDFHSRSANLKTGTDG